MNRLPPLRRIAITGSSGLYGRALVREIRRVLPAATLLGIDLAPPRSDRPDELVEADVLDPAVARATTAFRPDTVVHLAFAVEPGRDRRRMREVNLDGTRRVLAAAAGCDACRVLVSSSATVYGPWPEHALPCPEDTPLRPRPEFAYAADKGEVEALLTSFAARHPARAVSWTRPAIIAAPGVRNFLADIFLTLPWMPLPDGADTPLQFVHEADVAAATLAILTAGGRGPYNVAPADHLTQREIAAAMGIPAVWLPFWLVATAARAWWTLRLPWIRTPPGLAAHLRHPWLVDSTRLRRECGFACAYSSREAFAALLTGPTGRDSHTA